MSNQLQIYSKFLTQFELLSGDNAKHYDGMLTYVLAELYKQQYRTNLEDMDIISQLGSSIHQIFQNVRLQLWRDKTSRKRIRFWNIQPKNSDLHKYLWTKPHRSTSTVALSVPTPLTPTVSLSTTELLAKPTQSTPTQLLTTSTSFTTLSRLALTSTTLSTTPSMATLVQIPSPSSTPFTISTPTPSQASTRPALPSHLMMDSILMPTSSTPPLTPVSHNAWMETDVDSFVPPNTEASTSPSYATAVNS